MKVLAVDPGGTTGLAWVDTERDSEPLSIERPFMDALIWAWNACAQHDVELLLCETFVISAHTLKKTRTTESLESIGALRMVCHAYEIPFELQAPAEAKNFATNDRLKAIGWYTTKDHARDAVRHLLLGVARHRLVNLQDLVL